MLEKYLQIETLSVVLLGDFNPIILQPFWLSSKGLIREDEAKNAKIEIIHNELVIIDIDWIHIEITKNRCQFRTAKVPYFEPLKDLAVGIFKILRETPIYSIGLNHIYELSLLNEEKFYEFGNKLTPLNFWIDDLKDPRLMQLDIYENERIDGQQGNRRIKISKSLDQTIQYGVTINVNNHFDLKFNNSKLDFNTILDKNWKTSFSQTKRMIENLLNKIGL